MIKIVTIFDEGKDNLAILKWENSHHTDRIELIINDAKTNKQYQQQKTIFCHHMKINKTL